MRFAGALCTLDAAAFPPGFPPLTKPVDPPPGTLGPAGEMGQSQRVRTMGLDVGTKTVGVALSDELGWTGQALTTVRRTNLKADLAALKKIVEAHEVTRAVVGLPLNMDGSEGPRAQASREFARALEERVGLPVVLWDERLTTVAAERALLEADVSRQKRRQVIDQVAAALILQGWLDAQQKPSDNDEPEP